MCRWGSLCADGAKPKIADISGLRMDKDFSSSIFDKNYTYFSWLSEEVRQRELAKLAYHARWASFILAFGVAGRGNVFLPKHLHQEREKLKERINKISVKWNSYLEEIQGASNLFWPWRRPWSLLSISVLWLGGHWKEKGFRRRKHVLEFSPKNKR